MLHVGNGNYVAKDKILAMVLYESAVKEVTP